MWHAKSSQPARHHAGQSCATVSGSLAGLRKSAAETCTPGASLRTRVATVSTTREMFPVRKRVHSRFSVAFAPYTAPGQFVTAWPSAASKRARHPAQKQLSPPG